MERTSGLKKGLKAAAITILLATSMLSTGCGQNALMNPVSQTEVGGGATTANHDVNSANHDVNAANHDVNAANHDLTP
jgi:outer membrane murein-binding lipoprotein Lpp